MVSQGIQGNGKVYNYMISDIIISVMNLFQGEVKFLTGGNLSRTGVREPQGRIG